MRGKFVHITKRYGAYFIKSFVVVFFANLIIRGTLLVINSNIPSLWDGVCIFVVGGLFAIFQPDKGALISIGTIALSVAFLFWHDEEIAAQAEKQKITYVMHLGENLLIRILGLAVVPVIVQVLNEDEEVVATFMFEEEATNTVLQVKVSLTDTKSGENSLAYFIPTWLLQKVIGSYTETHINFQAIQEGSFLSICTPHLWVKMKVTKVGILSSRNPPLLLWWWVEITCLQTIHCERKVSE